MRKRTLRGLTGLLYVIPFLLFSAAPTVRAEPFKLFEKGAEDIVNYERYGKFHNPGTKQYRYVILKKDPLAKAAGEGIYPNTGVFKDPEYIRLNKQGRLKGSHWNFVNNTNHAINFYKWAATAEDPGVKQFYTALMFERMGMLKEAVKAYYAIVVFFPKTVSYTYWDSPIYLGPIAIDKIDFICRRNPRLGMKLVDAKITVENGYDTDVLNDKFAVHPGRMVRMDPDKVADKRMKFSGREIVKTIGKNNVRLVKYKNGHWQFFVENKPYMIKAMAYSPNKVGLSPDRGTVNPTRDWQIQDFNKNGLVDGPYEAWVDADLNNKQDPDEPVPGDAKLLAEMGCNTIRIYNRIVNKQLFRDLYAKHRIRLLIGDMVGGYAIESGATWADGTDYENAEQQNRMMTNVKQLVLEYKDEPYTLMWVLGNENVYGVGNNADKKPEAFFKLINRIARMIHEIDPVHPVAVCNGDLKFLDKIARYAPDVDVLGCNAYRGWDGFGRSLFEGVRDMMEKPVLITEYGCPAIAEGFSDKEALAFQAKYHKYNWEDIAYNSAGSGTGNALGGVIFEWVDEWWKANSDLPKRIQVQKKEWYAERSALYKNLQPENHDRLPQFGAPFLDGWSYEEWFGLFSMGDGSYSPFLRQKRPAYDTVKELWTRPD